VLVQIVHVEVAMLFEPVLVGLDGERVRQMRERQAPPVSVKSTTYALASRLRASWIKIDEGPAQLVDYPGSRQHLTLGTSGERQRGREHDRHPRRILPTSGMSFRLIFSTQRT
jgi:hypothetical protein